MMKKASTVTALFSDRETLLEFPFRESMRVVWSVTLLWSCGRVINLPEIIFYLIPCLHWQPR